MDVDEKKDMKREDVKEEMQRAEVKKEMQRTWKQAWGEACREGRAGTLGTHLQLVLVESVQAKVDAAPVCPVHDHVFECAGAAVSDIGGLQTGKGGQQEVPLRRRAASREHLLPQKQHPRVSRNPCNTTPSFFITPQISGLYQPTGICSQRFGCNKRSLTKVSRFHKGSVTTKVLPPKVLPQRFCEPQRFCHKGPAATNELDPKVLPPQRFCYKGAGP